MESPVPAQRPLDALGQAAKDNLNNNAAAGQDPSWVHTGTTIDGSRWNKLYPYQLVIVRRTDGGNYEEARFSNGSGASFSMSLSGGNALKFTLPIPPQSLTISTPFAINTTVTLGGIIEEHNAAPLRMISLTGTTGVIPIRPSPATTRNWLYGGTVDAVRNTVSAAKAMIKGGPNNSPNLVPEPLADGAEELYCTGYYQFRLLQQFLEAYVTMKKQRQMQDLRLAFCTWKDEAVYLVTPVQFDVSRNAGSAYEYSYSLSFRAWKRIKLDESAVTKSLLQNNAKDPATAVKIMKKIKQARDVVRKAGSIPQAVRGDVDAVLEYARQGIGFCQDVVGAVTEVANLPYAITQDLKGVAAQALQLKPDLLWGRIKEAVGFGADKKLQEDIRRLMATAKMTPVSPKVYPGSQTPSNRQAAVDQASIFSFVSENMELLSLFLISDFDLNDSQKRAIEADRVKNASKTQDEFAQERDKIQALVDDIADSLGLGDATYDSAFGRSPRPQTRVATPADFDVLFALNDIVTQFDVLAGTPTTARTSLSTVDAVAGLAEASGLAFTRPVSKYAVPFPYNSTLEQLAFRYLGDPQRWLEIVALNGLSSPYVDEVGFTYPLLVDGVDNEVVVASKTNLFIGQSLWVESSGFLRTKRRITNIQGLGPYAITVDGASNLSSFTVAQDARIRAYLPGTVNSSQTLYIPSQTPAQDEDFQTKAIPGVDYFDPLIQVGGIDLLVTGTGDLAMTPDGDVPLAYGLTNIVQKVKTALQTPKGSLIHFPDYGLGIPLGESTADVDAGQIKAGIQVLLSDDPTFDGIEGITVVKSGPTLSLSFNVRVRGVDGLIPLSFTVNR